MSSARVSDVCILPVLLSLALSISFFPFQPPASFNIKICYPNILGCVISHRCMINLASSYSLKLFLPLPRNNNSSMARDVIVSLILLSMLEFCLAWTCVGILYAAATPRSSYIQLPYCVQKILFPCSHPLPLVLLCLPPLLQ